MVVGDPVADKPLKMVELGLPYPHCIAIHNGIDRILTTSTVRASDLGDAGEAISAVEASTGKALGTYNLWNKPSPANEAPVDIGMDNVAKTMSPRLLKPGEHRCSTQFTRNVMLELLDDEFLLRNDVLYQIPN